MDDPFNEPMRVPFRIDAVLDRALGLPDTQRMDALRSVRQRNAGGSMRFASEHLRSPSKMESPAAWLAHAGARQRRFACHCREASQGTPCG